MLFTWVLCRVVLRILENRNHSSPLDHIVQIIHTRLADVTSCGVHRQSGDETHQVLSTLCACCIVRFNFQVRIPCAYSWALCTESAMSPYAKLIAFSGEIHHRYLGCRSSAAGACSPAVI